ncbi:hypothetical protein KAU43_04620 [candidate division WOR-3 bacterium]|nr:hypothetical protein [candidate division WOR-3 bacterium]
MNDFEKLFNALIPYLPRNITRKIRETGKSEVYGEKRYVTVMFIDVSDFTGLSEKLPPENVAEIVNDLVNKYINIIHSRGGEINKFIGDAILALWGTTLRSEKDEENACSAAVEIQKVTSLFPKVKYGKFIRKIRVSIGINSGPVVALNIGNFERMEYSVLGDTVNIAARLESYATSGDTVVSEKTLSKIKNKFIINREESINVKGKKDSIKIYNIVSTKSILGEEIYIERDIDNIFRDKISKEGFKIIEITGKHLSGKTSLIDHNLDTYLSFKYFSGDFPYNFIRIFIYEIFKNTSLKTDDPDINYIKKWVNNVAHTIEKNTIVIGLEKILKNLFLNKYKAIYIDLKSDIDSKSIEVFSKLQERKQLGKGAIVFESDKAIGIGIEKIEVKSLSKKKTEIFVKTLTNSNGLNKKQGDEIWKLSEGNAGILKMYISELISNEKLIYENNDIKLEKGWRDILFKSYVEYQIKEFDKLSPQTQSFIYFVSFSEHGVPIKILDAIGQWNIDNIKSEIADKNLLIIVPEKAVIADRMLRKAIYNRLIKTDVKGIASDISNAFKANKPNSITELNLSLKAYEILGIKQNIAESYLNIAKKYLEYLQLDEALKTVRKALEIFKKSNEQNKYEDAIFVIGNIYSEMHRYKDANRWYLKIKDTDNPELKGKIFINLGIVYSSIGKYDLSINMFDNAIEYTKGEDRARAYINKAFDYDEIRKYDKIKNMLDKAKEFAESEHLKGDIALNYAHYYEYSDNFKKSESYYNKAIQYYQSENNKISTMDASNSYGLLLMNHEKVNSAKDIFRKCFELAEILQDFTMIAKLHNNLGVVEIQLGNEKDAIFNFTKAKGIAEKINNYDIQVLALANLGDYYLSKCRIGMGFDNYKIAVNNVSFVSDKFTKLYCNIQYVKLAILYGEIDNLPNIFEQLENETLQFEDKHLLSLFLFNKLLYKFVNDMFWDKGIESEIEKIDALEKDDRKILKFIKVYFNKDNINNYIKFLIDVKDIVVNEEFMKRIEDKYDLIDRNIIYKYIYDLSSVKKRDLILKYWAISSKDTGSFLIISKFLRCKINFLKETPSLQGMIRKDLNDLLTKVYKNNENVNKYIDRLLS